MGASALRCFCVRSNERGQECGSVFVSWIILVITLLHTYGILWSFPYVSVFLSVPSKMGGCCDNPWILLNMDLEWNAPQNPPWFGSAEALIKQTPSLLNKSFSPVWHVSATDRVAAIKKHGQHV